MPPRPLCAGERASVKLSFIIPKELPTRLRNGSELRRKPPADDQKQKNSLRHAMLRIGFTRRCKDEPTPIEQGILWETESSRFIQRLRSTETRDAFVTDSLKIVKRDEAIWSAGAQHKRQLRERRTC